MTTTAALADLAVRVCQSSRYPARQECFAILWNASGKPGYHCPPGITNEEAEGRLYSAIRRELAKLHPARVEVLLDLMQGEIAASDPALSL